MRDIKFRAWHKKRKKFYEVLNLHIYTIMNRGPWATCKGRNCIEQQDVHIQVQPEDCLIEQFTGLLDKNGKDIYEGDILHCDSENFKGKVWFSSGSFQSDCSGWGDQNLSNYSDDDIEIIGNIHENPELLGETS